MDIHFEQQKTENDYLKPFLTDVLLSTIKKDVQQIIVKCPDSENTSTSDCDCFIPALNTAVEVKRLFPVFLRQCQ